MRPRSESRRLFRFAFALAMSCSLTALSGCDFFGGDTSTDEKPEVSGNVKTSGSDKDKQPPKPKGPAAPAYDELARKYNLERVRYLDRILARVNILITYFDEEGNEKTENPDGTLQIIRPNKLSLSLKKAEHILFWFGCDPEQYWWFDLTDKSKRLAAIGRHENFSDATAERIGLPIAPLDLIRVVGVVPLDPAAKGATQWSDDRKLIGITSPIGDRGFQRLWIEPDSLRPTMIEVFDRDREKILVAEHEGEERVEISRDIPGGTLVRAFMPSRVHITHLPTDTRARITMTAVSDKIKSEATFDLKTLLKSYPVDKAIDLDARKSN